MLCYNNINPYQVCPQVSSTQNGLHKWLSAGA